MLLVAMALHALEVEKYSLRTKRTLGEGEGQESRRRTAQNAFHEASSKNG
jgi:hypothetical protein